MPPVLTLGSQSPRRLELLSHLVPRNTIAVLPPRDSTESGFDDCDSLADIDRRLLGIVRDKQADVRAQAVQAPILTADTVIVVFDADGRPLTLGKPPEAQPQQREVLLRWFLDYYAQRPHLAKTALSLTIPDDPPRELIVTTEIQFRVESREQVEWYLATGEPQGKAGGYAIQGAGSLFVSAVRGSLSNVVGLPLFETRQLLAGAGLLR